MELTGIHHLTAVSAAIGEPPLLHADAGHAAGEARVNQDDVSAYHLFYADAKGSPGTDLTFFDWPVPRERRGTRSIVRTCLRVNGEAAVEVVGASGSMSRRPARRDLRARRPPDPALRGSRGQRLALVDDGGAGDPPAPWERSPVPAEHQIRGLGPIVISVPTLEPDGHAAHARLQHAPGARVPASRQSRARGARVRDGDAAARTPSCTSRCSPTCPSRARARAACTTSPSARPTRTTTPGRSGLNEFGVPNSGKVDRFWFRSLYVREPNGVLFEIATDGPGFAVDEDAATLGEKVVLPPFLEPHREQIVANLKPID